MKVDKFFFMIVLLSVSVCCNLILIIHQHMIYSDITKSMKQQEIYFNVLQDKLEEASEALIVHDQALQSGITDIYGVSAEILANLHSLHGVANSQYNSTVEMENHYRNLLFEQQQKTVTTAEYDASLQGKRQNAFILMERELFVQAHKLFSEVALINPEDYECRFYSIYTLFYSNPLDSRHYNRILQEISILQKNEYRNDNMQKIIDFIAVETGRD